MVDETIVTYKAKIELERISSKGYVSITDILTNEISDLDKTSLETRIDQYVKSVVHPPKVLTTKGIIEYVEIKLKNITRLRCVSSNTEYCEPAKDIIEHLEYRDSVGRILHYLVTKKNGTRSEFNDACTEWNFEYSDKVYIDTEFTKSQLHSNIVSHWHKKGYSIFIIPQDTVVLTFNKECSI